MDRRTLSAMVVVSVLSSVNPAAAASILIDAGKSTIDPGTNLEWLDLTLTAGHSYEEVLAGYKGYTTTGGWRFATRADVVQLIVNAGGTNGQSEETTFPNDTYNIAQHLLNLFGTTVQIENPPPNLQQSAYGITSDTIDTAFGNGFMVAGGFTTFTSSNGDYYSAYFSDFEGVILPDFASSQFGSFLIRPVSVATTPIPATLPLFISAIAGLGYLRWRRRA